jgi:hypothetical protein
MRFWAQIANANNRSGDRPFVMAQRQTHASSVAAIGRHDEHDTPQPAVVQELNTIGGSLANGDLAVAAYHHWPWALAELHPAGGTPHPTEFITLKASVRTEGRRDEQQEHDFQAMRVP